MTRIIEISNFRQWKYAWRASDGPFSGESSWSILHKFCLRNAIGMRELIEHLNSMERDKRVSLTVKMDMRFDKGGLLSSLNNAANIQIVENKNSTLEQISGHNDVRHLARISANYLRFCPICIFLGFHHTINQFLFIENCQLHTSIKLFESCPNCGAKIPYIPPKSLAEAYSCPSCLQSLLNGSKMDSNNSEILERLNQNNNPFLVNVPIGQTSFGMTNTGMISDCDLSRFVKFGGFLIGISPPWQGIEKIYNICSQEILIHSHKDDCRKSSVANFISYDIHAIYKSISRHVAKRRIHLTRDCFNSICNRDWGRVFSRSEFRKIKEHYAYAAWRWRWENVPNTRALLSHHHSARQDIELLLVNCLLQKYQFSYLNDISSKLKYEIIRRIFAIECLNSFQQILRESISVTREQWERGCELPLLSWQMDGSVFFNITQKSNNYCELKWFIEKNSCEIDG